MTTMNNIDLHPNLIFAKILNMKKTDKGVFLPETHTSKTPIAEVLSVGANIELVKEGDVVYVDPSYMRFAEMEGVEGVILMPDGIFATIKEFDKDVSF